MNKIIVLLLILWFTILLDTRKPPRIAGVDEWGFSSLFLFKHIKVGGIPHLNIIIKEPGRYRDSAPLTLSREDKWRAESRRRFLESGACAWGSTGFLFCFSR